MKLLFQLLGEHPELPLAEIKGVLEGENLRYKILEGVEEKRLFLLEVKTKNPEFMNRLALTKHVARFISKRQSLAKLGNDIYKAIPPDKKTFAIRSRSHSLEKELGASIVKFNLTVNLQEPQVEILCFQVNKTYYAGVNLPLGKKNFEERRVQFRPYFSPTSMHPKMARLLVNLARVKSEDTLLDPFCGTGGILIEAALMGMKIRGFDWDKRAVEGCQKNLRFYNLEGKISQGDALELKLKEKTDAIVTDLPYGRSSLRSEKNLGKMYKNFLMVASDNLKLKGFLVIVLPEGYNLTPPSNLSLQETYKIYVHKSLTRRILVLKKKK